MKTIVLATQKGGSGKTTLAIGLALAAIQAGHTVRLIETDSQGTLSNWQSRRPYAEPIVEPIYAAGDFEQRLQSLDRSGVTLAIIDTAGGVNAATALGEEAALDISGVVAIPFIVMRNDHQDALSAGLAVNEYAPGSKSAEEIRGLWQWVEAKLNAGATIQDEPFVGEVLEAPLATMFVETPAEAAAFVA